MPYTLSKSNGQLLTTLADGSIDIAHTSLTLIGKDYAGYGQFLNENLIYMLENFANSASPANPIAGQLWWDTTNNILRVYSGTTWKISTGATSSPTGSPPTDLSSLGGDLWFDTTLQQLKVYTGTSWLVVGPVSTPATGQTGAVPALMVDNSSASHVVIQFVINGVVYAIFSKDTFQTSTAGFSTIVAGINFSTIAVPGLGISTQSIPATASSLVQRDSNGSIFANIVSATSISTGSLTSAGAINGTFNGNLTGTTVTVGSTLLTSSLTTTPAITVGGGTGSIAGNIVTSSQPGIKTLGGVTALTVAGTTTLTGTATLNGNVIATVGGSASFTVLDNTPIGTTTANTGRFTTLTVTSLLTPPASGNTTINSGATNAWWGSTYSLNYTGSNYNGGIFTGGAFNGGTFTGTAFNVTGAGTVGGASAIFSGATFNGGTFSGTTVAASVSMSAPTFTGTNFNGGTFNGTATTALYADLAERYASDAQYSPGTVVELGGTAEITQAVYALSENVFGVISTDPAYLMNAKLVNGLPVALAGRVPVRVIGKVTRGDRLVSAGNGVARAAARVELTPFNVIGRALEDKTTTEESLIEVAVKIN